VSFELAAIGVEEAPESLSLAMFPIALVDIFDNFVLNLAIKPVVSA
jgi:hypothetical protein